MEKRRAESAGTFIIASEILKPRISHSREPRLSKMHLVTRLQGVISKRVKPKHASPQRKHTFTYIFTHDLMQMVAVLLLELLSQTHFLK